jgi:DNA helicase-4
MLSALFRLIPSSVTQLGLIGEAQKAKDSDNPEATLKPFVFVLSRTKHLKGLKVKPGAITFVQATKDGKDLLFVEEALTVVCKNKLSPSSIRVLTAHSSKGKEAEVVVLLSPEQFPLIHPSSAFLGIFGDTIDQIINDERRLFYVACSRAKRWLLLLTFSPQKQPYFLPRDMLDSFDWKEAPYVLSVPEGRYRVEVTSMPTHPSATYQIRQNLKERGFQYDSRSPQHIWWQVLECSLPDVAQYLVELIADSGEDKVQWALFDAVGNIRFSWPGPVDPVSFVSASQESAMHN